MDELILTGPGEAYVKVVEDSISAYTGDRVTSFEVNGWRFTLAEWNTHSLFVRNSASSRAIPVEKQLARYKDTPAMPLAWTSEQPGMQGGVPLEGMDLRDAQNFFDNVHTATGNLVRYYLDAHPEKSSRLHKSLVNRLMEPFQWHLMLITASSYENFFEQRVSPLAQPELEICAALMKELHAKSDPVELWRGDWHLPYVRGRDIAEIEAQELDPREISTARCARTSYMTQDGVRDLSKDLELYHGNLMKNGHWSPFAHVCTPDPSNVQDVKIYDPDTAECLGSRRVSRMGHFIGFQQWRHVVEGRMGYVSQR